MNTNTRPWIGALAVLGLSTVSTLALYETRSPEAAERVGILGGLVPGLAPDAADAAGAPDAAGPLRTRTGDATAAGPAGPAEASWVAGELMVAPAPGVALGDIAARYGATVLRPAGRAGIGLLSLPPGLDAGLLRADPDVAQLAPQGRTRAASTLPEAQAAVATAQAELAAAVADFEAISAELAEAQDLLTQAENDLADAIDDDASAETLAALEAAEAEAQGLVDDTELAWETAEDTVDTAELALAAAEGAAESAASAAAALLWHLPHSHHPAWVGDGQFDASTGSGVVVAVLDSGIAMDTAGGPAAPSLAGHSFTAPADIVDGDSSPDDAHQHGTHIASLIGGRSGVYGMAPGASLMPVRVLDANNSGTELDLIEGIWHAIDNGADVINLSLTFGPDYVPSRALSAALTAAADAGIVMVAAAGNDAGASTRWPAASPHVIAVGATRLDDRRTTRKGALADYTNRGLAIDLVAAGGDTTLDVDQNGIVDGIVGETFSPDDPSAFGSWAYAGTSQAAALVSGAAALLLADGASAADVRGILQQGARNLPEGHRWTDGFGAGELNLENSIADMAAETRPVSRVYAGVLPWMKKRGNNTRPRFELAIIDETGAPVADAKVVASAWSDGSDPVAVTCTTDASGLCGVSPWGTLRASEAAAGAYALRVETVRRGDTGAHPTPVLFATDALAVLQAALASDLDLADALLGISWSDGSDPYLGDTVASYAVVDWGAGLASSPLGVVLGPDALPDGGLLGSDTLDLDGSGLASSPLGVLPLELLQVSGTGLASSPLGIIGISELDIAFIDGSGLASSPLGFTAVDITLPGGMISGTGLASSPLGYTGEPIFLGEGEIGGLDADDALLTAINSGSFLGSLPLGGATALIGAGAVATAEIDTEAGSSAGPVAVSP